MGTHHLSLTQYQEMWKLQPCRAWPQLRQRDMVFEANGFQRPESKATKVLTLSLLSEFVNL